MPRSSGSATGSPALTGKASSMAWRQWPASRGSPSSKRSARRRLAVAGAENAGGQSQRQARARRAERARFRHACAPSTSRTCRSPTCRFAFDANATETEVAFDAADRDPQRHRPHRDPRRRLGRRGPPSRRARQAPPRRARLRRHLRSGAAAPVAALLHRAGARALCGDPQGPRRRGRCGEPAHRRAGLGSRAGRCGRPRPRDPRPRHRLRRAGRPAAALRRLPARRRQRRARARAPAPRRPQPRRHPVLGHPEDLRAVHPREPVLRPRRAGRDRHPPPDPRRARRRPAVEDLGRRSPTERRS